MNPFKGEIRRLQSRKQHPAGNGITLKQRNSNGRVNSLHKEAQIWESCCGG